MAGRYFEAALRQARGLGNTHLIERLSAQIEQIEKSSASQQRLVDSVRTISDILSRTGSYRESLESLVSFAVEHTGAERGVLLLRKEQEAAMRAAASVNCDDQSRADIERFSSSIPGAVVRSAESLIVDNARSDDRTARFQSIVTHNILSVICVPILHQNEVLGALYLDHHSVPSLFKEEDLTWIETVANFVGVALITAQSSRKLQTDRQRIVGELEEAGRSTDFLTADPGMRRLLDQLPNIASSSAPVLIVGEPGTGKEILADMIHRQSPRSDKPFLKMNCAAVPEDMAESELFGVARGAATGVTEREGKLSAADEGTLLLDEIGDMPLSLQAKLLRAVEYQSFERLGSNRTVYVDVRLLYATNKNLNELVANDLFRADLLDRIQVIKLKITPLRERRGDIPLLLDHFLKVFAAGRPAPRFSDEAMAALKSYRWPGNVRELKNVVEHCTILYSGAFITPDMLPVELGATAGVRDTKETIEEAEAARIRQALAETNWNKSQAARLLGMHVSSLRRRMEKYDIQS
jgi:Nif-specific regulatory protein